jgi:hypothetical protein
MGEAKTITDTPDKPSPISEVSHSGDMDDADLIPLRTQVMELVNGELRSARIALCCFTSADLCGVFPAANECDLLVKLDQSMQPRMACAYSRSQS